jgi:hypothetical protein
VPAVELVPEPCTRSVVFWVRLDDEHERIDQVMARERLDQLAAALDDEVVVGSMFQLGHRPIGRRPMT